jgi:hypothetical protein
MSASISGQTYSCFLPSLVSLPYPGQGDIASLYDDSEADGGELWRRRTKTQLLRAALISNL